MKIMSVDEIQAKFDNCDGVELSIPSHIDLKKVMKKLTTAGFDVDYDLTMGRPTCIELLLNIKLAMVLFEGDEPYGYTQVGLKDILKTNLITEL